MKYLRPTDDDWNTFVTELKDLFAQYATVVDISKLDFPADWNKHFQL